MTSSRARLLIVALAVVVAAVGAFIFSRVIGGTEEPDARMDEPGEYELTAPTVTGVDQMPQVPLRSADGEEVRLAPDGRPMVVNLWNSTCAPCARELADFAAVDAAVRDEVRFVGVNNFDDADRMVEFAQERGVEYELLLDEGSDFTDEIGTAVLPVTLFVDTSGATSVHVGALTEDELRAELTERWGIG